MCKRINPEILTIARESRGISQSNFAKSLAITQGRLSKIENGLLDNVPDDLLSKISNHLDYPKNFFYSTDRVFGLGVHTIYHRKRRTLPSKTLNRIQAQISIMQIHLTRLLRRVGTDYSAITRRDINEDDNINQVVDDLRDSWSLKDGPLDDLTSVVENAGGIVIWYDFGTHLIDGLSRWLPNLPPMFFLNKNAPGDRLRFSLSHELGHIIMHRIPNENMEDQANKFAAELLMPEKEIKPFLNTINLSEFAKLKLHWKVSIASLIYRARSLQTITDRQASYLWMQMSRAGYKTKEPAELDIPKEKPTKLRKIIEFICNELSYSKVELCDYLTINAKEFDALYNIREDKPYLFAVS